MTGVEFQDPHQAESVAQFFVWIATAVGLATMTTAPWWILF